MASSISPYNNPTGSFQRPVQVNYKNELNKSHSKNSIEQNSSPA
jgi:hypothetical protein